MFCLNYHILFICSNCFHIRCRTSSLIYMNNTYFRLFVFYSLHNFLPRKLHRYRTHRLHFLTIRQNLNIIRLEILYLLLLFLRHLFNSFFNRCKYFFVLYFLRLNCIFSSSFKGAFRSE